MPSQCTCRTELVEISRAVMKLALRVQSDPNCQFHIQVEKYLAENNGRG